MLFSQLRTFVFYLQKLLRYLHTHTHTCAFTAGVYNPVTTDGNHVLTRNMTTCPCVVVDVVVHFA